MIAGGGGEPTMSLPKRHSTRCRKIAEIITRSGAVEDWNVDRKFPTQRKGSDKMPTGKFGINDAQKKEICRLAIEEGVKHGDIGKQFNIPVESVNGFVHAEKRRTRKQMGVEMPPVGAKPNALRPEKRNAKAIGFLQSEAVLAFALEAEEVQKFLMRAGPARYIEPELRAFLAADVDVRAAILLIVAKG